MGFVVLTQVSRVAAVATCERLGALGIEAQILDQPNLFTKLSSGGRHTVRVAVDEAELARARAELARWELEAAPRVAALGREFRARVLLGGVPALLWLASVPLLALEPVWYFAAGPVWFVGVVLLLLWERWKGASGSGGGVVG
jgi:hypothetical protein